MIKKIDTIEDCKKCDELLTKLILDERQYDESIDKEIVINEFYEKSLNDDTKILFGCYENDVLVGYLFLIENYSNNNKGYFIDALYVEEDYRNKGYGNGLINEAISYAESHDGTFIDIKVLSDNNIAKNLYKNNGFNEFKVIMRKGLSD